jgi:hypothetical protein
MRVGLHGPISSIHLLTLRVSVLIHSLDLSRNQRHNQMPLAVCGSVVRFCL